MSQASALSLLPADGSITLEGIRSDPKLAVLVKVLEPTEPARESILCREWSERHARTDLRQALEIAISHDAGSASRSVALAALQFELGLIVKFRDRVKIGKLRSWEIGSIRKAVLDALSFEGTARSKVSSGVPPLRSNAYNVDWLDEDQREFYEWWKQSWAEGVTRDIDNQFEYVRTYIYELDRAAHADVTPHEVDVGEWAGREEWAASFILDVTPEPPPIDPEKLPFIIDELSRIDAAYGDNVERVRGWCRLRISDYWAELGEFDRAVESCEPGSSHWANLMLNYRHRRGEPIEAGVIVAGESTAWGSADAESVMSALSDRLSDSVISSQLEAVLKDAWAQGEHVVWGQSSYCSLLTHEPLRAYLRGLVRDSVNDARGAAGYYPVGGGRLRGQEERQVNRWLLLTPEAERTHYVKHLVRFMRPGGSERSEWSYSTSCGRGIDIPAHDPDLLPEDERVQRCKICQQCLDDGRDPPWTSHRPIRWA